MPISRDTLTDGDRVRELLEEARECPHTGDNDIFAVDAYLRVNFEKEGNIRMADIATALSRFTEVDVHPIKKSPAMVARINKVQGEK